MAAKLAQRARARLAGSARLRQLLGKPAAAPANGSHGSNASAAALGDEWLPTILDRYAGAEPAAISYETVRDLSDSIANLPGLVGRGDDLGELQRGWMLKAIVGAVEPGSRVLEVRGTDPLVAGVLSRLGYEVTVVELAGRVESESERAATLLEYPDLRFVRDQLPPGGELGTGWAAVYSTAALQQLPPEELGETLAGLRGLLAPGGCSVHALSHVVAGAGAEEHAEKLRRAVAALGLSEQELERQLASLAADPETYFLSAAEHARLRGDLDYESYPMRRVASVNLFARA